MQFQYTLQKEEYQNYCKFELLNDPDIRKLRKRALPALPVGLIFIFIIFRLTHWIFYVGAVLISLAWIYVVDKMVARIVVVGARDKCEKIGSKAYKPIDLVLEEGVLRVNGTKQTLAGYRIFMNLILLFIKEGSTVILPARVIGGEDAEHVSPVILALDQCKEK